MASPVPQRPEAVMAWVAALDASLHALCRHRGHPPIDASAVLTAEQHGMAWDAAAALAAGLTALAEACRRHGVAWDEILELARQDHAESQRHRSAATTDPGR